MDISLHVSVSVLRFYRPKVRDPKLYVPEKVMIKARAHLVHLLTHKN